MENFDEYGVEYNECGDTLIRVPIHLEGEYVVPENVFIIGKEAFSYCRKLTSVILSDNVISIGDHAFSHCSRLKMLQMKKNICDIGEEAFLSCVRLERLTLYSSLTHIGKNAFANCRRLEIYIPLKERKIITKLDGVKDYLAAEALKERRKRKHEQKLKT